MQSWGGKGRGGENGKGKGTSEKPGWRVAYLALERPWLEGPSVMAWGSQLQFACWNHLRNVCSCRGSDGTPHLAKLPFYAKRNLVLSEETPLSSSSSYKLCDLTEPPCLSVLVCTLRTVTMRPSNPWNEVMPTEPPAQGLS